MAFQGTFDFTLDAKNRLTIPSKLRAAFGDGVVLAAGLEPCVAVWRPADYDEWREQALAGHNRLSPRYRDLKRYLSAHAQPLELDGAGRVMVPSFLMAHAGLGRDVALLGADECLEIWDRARWAEHSRQVTANIADIAAGLGG